MDPAKPRDSDAVDPVEALVAQALERLAAGESGVIEALCSANPERDAELRERFAALRDMNLLPADRAAMAFPERLGEFRLLRRLGGGGMGVVYEAIQEPLGRNVALKLIRPEHLYFERSRERFKRETDAVARLSHPGVVAIYTVGEAAGTPYFAMEMIRGATVAQALEQVRGLAPEGLLGSDLRAAVQACADPEVGASREAQDNLYEGSWVDACVRVIQRMTEALDHAHARGVLHRDIKPSNIALTLEGRVVLLDFGLAGLEDELRMTRSGSALGSVLYMAPEQVAGRVQEIDARTDVYALGVTLYEMLTLQTPYAAADSEQTRAAILEGLPPPIRARHRGVPRDLEIVCLHAIDRDRARRYPSMAAFGADLRNVLEGRPINVRPPSAAYRTRRWIARHPTLSATIALSGLLLTVLPSALYFQQRSNNAALRELLAEVSAAKERASEESQRARVAAEEAELSAAFLVELFGASDPYASGRRDLTAREMLDAGLGRVEAELGDQPELQARLFERIGLSYNNLDLYVQALVPLGKALALRRRLHGDDDPRTAGALMLLGSAQRLAGEPGCTALLREAHEIFARHPTDDVVTQVNTEALLALCLLDEGQTEEPLELLASAHRRIEELHIDNAQLRWMVSNVLATTHQRLGHHQQAEVIARETLEREGSAELPPTLAPWRCAALNTLGTALRDQGRLAEARAVFEELLPEARSIYEAGNPTLSLMESEYADALYQLGERLPAIELLERATIALRAQLGPQASKSRRVLYQFADAAIGAHQPERALEQLRISEAALETDPGDGMAMSTGRFRIGLALLALGDRTEAAAWLRRCDPALFDGASQARALVEISLARALVGAPETRDEAEQLAQRWSEPPGSELALVARMIAARAAWLDARRERAAELARAVLADLQAGTQRSWLGLEARILLADLALERALDPEICRELDASYAALAAELGARHADVAELDAQLESSGAWLKCREVLRR